MFLEQVLLNITALPYLFIFKNESSLLIFFHCRTSQSLEFADMHVAFYDEPSHAMLPNLSQMTHSRRCL